MVKAFAYGSGSAEVAQLLQFHRVDYLAVAYADEGVSLRQNGITLPIMVMNPAPETFASLLEHNLEPEIYSMKLLREWARFLEKGEEGEEKEKGEEGEERGESVCVPSSLSSPSSPSSPLSLHLKIDTGMHRLGFLERELPDVVAYLNDHPGLARSHRVQPSGRGRRSAVQQFFAAAIRYVPAVFGGARKQGWATGPRGTCSTRRVSCASPTSG